MQSTAVLIFGALIVGGEIYVMVRRDKGWGPSNKQIVGITRFGDACILLQLVWLFAWCVLLALIICWTKAWGWKAGAKKGAIVGFLVLPGWELPTKAAA